MLRVVLGRARPDIEWSRKISGLQFASAPAVQESTRSRGPTSTILTVPRSHREEEVDLEAHGPWGVQLSMSDPPERGADMDGINERRDRI